MINICSRFRKLTGAKFDILGKFFEPNVFSSSQREKIFEGAIERKSYFCRIPQMVF